MFSSYIPKLWRVYGTDLTIGAGPQIKIFLNSLKFDKCFKINSLSNLLFVVPWSLTLRTNLKQLLVINFYSATNAR